MTEEKFTVLFESQFSVGSNELVFQVKVRPCSPIPRGLPKMVKGPAQGHPAGLGKPESSESSLPWSQTSYPVMLSEKPTFTLPVPVFEVIIWHQLTEFRRWVKKK